MLTKLCATSILEFVPRAECLAQVLLLMTLWKLLVVSNLRDQFLLQSYMSYSTVQYRTVKSY